MNDLILFVAITYYHICIPPIVCRTEYMNTLYLTPNPPFRLTTHYTSRVVRVKDLPVAKKLKPECEKDRFQSSFQATNRRTRKETQIDHLTSSCSGGRVVMDVTTSLGSGIFQEIGDGFGRHAKREFSEKPSNIFTNSSTANREF